MCCCSHYRLTISTRSTYWSAIPRPERHTAAPSGALRFHTPLSLSVRSRREFERTTARDILTRTKFATSEYSRFHFVARSAARRRSAVLALFPGNPSTEYTRGQKSRCLSLQACPYFVSFSFSAFASTVADDRLRYAGASVSVTRMSKMQTRLRSKKPLAETSPRASSPRSASPPPGVPSPPLPRAMPRPALTSAP